MGQRASTTTPRGGFAGASEKRLGGGFISASQFLSTTASGATATLPHFGQVLLTSAVPHLWQYMPLPAQCEHPKTYFGRVIAPSDADETSAQYFPKTPVAYRSFGVLHCAILR